MVSQSIAFVFLFPWIEICSVLHLFLTNGALYALFVEGLRQFSICSPFPPVIVISPVSETIILCLWNFFSAFSVHLALPMVKPKQSTSVRVGFFLLSIFELFLRQIQFRFLKQWALCAFLLSVVPTTFCFVPLQIKPFRHLFWNHQCIIV
jgi:hypothetical protein